MQNDVSYSEHTLSDIAQVNGEGMMISKSLSMALLFQGAFDIKFKPTELVANVTQSRITPSVVPGLAPVYKLLLVGDKYRD